MKLINFVKSLLPHMDKNDVMEDIDVTKSELSTGVIPCYQSASVYFKAGGIKSKEALELQKVFYRNFDVKLVKKKENMVSDVFEALGNVRSNLDYISEQIENLFNKDIIKDGLTVRKAMLLRAADHISFISRYSIDFLNLIYIMESKASETELSEGFKGNEKIQEMVEKNVYIFGRLLSAYAQPTDKFKDLSVKIPEAVLNDETADKIVALYKDNELEPIPNAVIQNFEGNPIYHIRIMIAEWQANRYKSFKDKKRMLELRLLHLKSLESGSDPKLEKEIEYIQDRIETLDYRMKKMEEQ